ncbi:GNAT family N-acetyltransferase [Aquipuribacter nitratireducens]|uniref:GNAT family N-acetyltransferase n=1 Tax=Aquipuribacter nitratireducens TaxID=650104 RepID=A0ABW0GJS9_9MICO
MSGPAAARVRRAAPDDVAALAALAREHHGTGGWEERLREALMAGELVLVAEEPPGTIVGYARAGVRAPSPDDLPDDPSPSGWYVTGLVVAVAHRRRGVARRLVADVLAMRPAGEPVWSVVNARDEMSLALHAALGFTEVLRASRMVGIAFTGGEGVLLRHDPP